MNTDVLKPLTDLPVVNSDTFQGRSDATSIATASSSDNPSDSQKRLLQQILDLDVAGYLKSSSFADPSADILSLEVCVQEFRGLLTAEIAKSWPGNQVQAQQISNLLDGGNRLIAAYEKAQQKEQQRAQPPASAKAVYGSADTFWDAPRASWQGLLEFKATRKPGPATLPAQGAGLNKRRRQDGLSKGTKRRQTEWQGVVRARGKGLSLSKEVQQQLAIFLELVVEPLAPQIHLDDLDTSEGTPAQILIQRAVRALHEDHWGESLVGLPLDFSEVCDQMSQGSLSSMNAILDSVVEACETAGIEAGYGNPRIKEHLHSQSEALGQELILAVKDLVQAFQREGVVVAKTVFQPIQQLPESIQANFEAYAQGEWHKKPYPVRAYERLQNYFFEQDSDILAWKMSTTKRSQCSGSSCLSHETIGSFSMEKEAFQTDCQCLAKNAECGSGCECWGKKCLNSVIQRRATLRLGIDVVEQDTWGMDCYTRRNIQDAILESEVFGPYVKPDYEALIKCRNAMAMTHGETVQHSLKGSDAGIAQPVPEKPGDGVQQAAPEAPEEAPQNSIPKAKAAEWHETVLLPAIHGQGLQGWNLRNVLEAILAEHPDSENSRAAAAVLSRLKQVGESYFRVHPKGKGILCEREEGIPPLTFVEEYFGSVYTPSRWLEIQDAVKKRIGVEVLPDFYNMQLERPKDDPAGYDCVFIDAASKGSFVSRMSHSCTPNCQAIPMRAGDRLTIALYTLRKIRKGEELTFDYSCVTESEKEFRAAICLCGTTACRGSFLYFAGSKAYMQVLVSHQSLFTRQMVILKAGQQSLSEADQHRLEVFGVRDCMLCWGKQKPKIPVWLQKWVCLALEFVELEQKLLPQQLIDGPPMPGVEPFTSETAASQAKGVSDNRLQNIAITLDKIKLCLSQKGQAQDAPLEFLEEAEVVDYLWAGERSVAKRLLRCAAAWLSNAAIGKLISSAETLKGLNDALKHAKGFTQLLKLGRFAMRKSTNLKDAQLKLVQLSKMVRSFESKHTHCAAADLLLLYANTTHWFRACRSYKGFTSAPIYLSEVDLQLKQTSPSKAIGMSISPPQHHPAILRSAANGPGEASAREEASLAKDGHHLRRSDRHNSLTAAANAALMTEANVSHPPLGDPETEMVDVEGSTAIDTIAPAVLRNGQKDRGGVCKKYGPWFIWGQLNFWYKQTISDPTASLSAERRGTISLPDIESSFVTPRSRYTAKEREYVLEQIQQRPESPWRTNSMWTFKNEAKIFGSPMFDAAWARETDGRDPMPELIEQLTEVS